MRSPALRLHVDELVVDNFAGGGGASTGIGWATGRSPDIAVNHDPEAIAMHRANHPQTEHHCESVWEVDPVAVCAGRPVGLAWFSPDCTFHSKARGAKPFRDRDAAKRRRGLAWVVTRWARAVRPRVIVLENVEEFQQWGPLLDDGKPDPDRRGFTYRRWRAQLENLGYAVDARELRACDFGAPTTRKRLFVQARCDGQPIAWPEPTHGPARAAPYRTAAEVIDWSIPCPSIFGRKKPLSENTLRRIARGLRKYVIEAAEPFIIPVTHAGDERAHSVGEPLRTVTCAHRGEFALIAPAMIQQSWGERKGQAPRCLDLQQPIGTLMAQGIKHAAVTAFLAKHYGGHETPGSRADAPVATITTTDHNAVVTSHIVKLRGRVEDRQSSSQGVDEPLPTLTAGGTHVAEVRAFLIKYYGADGRHDQGQQLGLPLATLTTKPRFGLVTVHGVDYVIVDIGMRMLTPRELFCAQGFGDDYLIESGVEADGSERRFTKGTQVQMCGNSVAPPAARAVVEAALGAS